MGRTLKLKGQLGIYDSPARVNDFETSFLILFVLGLCVRQFVARNNSTGILSISATLFGLMYVPWLLNFIQKIYFFRDVEGRFYLLYFILITKFSDSGAYAVGSLIGRHKMIPRISPGKTWEGFAGAIVVSTGASLIFAHVAHDHMPALTPMHAVILGVILSCAAVIGDLIESLFKREAGVKDSGKFFPGIGGMLDLLDSILFNAPLMYIYLRRCLSVHEFTNDDLRLTRYRRLYDPRTNEGPDKVLRKPGGSRMPGASKGLAGSDSEQAAFERDVGGDKLPRTWANSTKDFINKLQVVEGKNATNPFLDGTARGKII